MVPAPCQTFLTPPHLAVFRRCPASAGLYFNMKGDNLVKKYLVSFLCVMFLSLFAALPVFADETNFNTANFTGVNFNWHSGPAVPPAHTSSGYNHFLIIYSAPSTWYTGDRDYTYYYQLNDNITSINLRIDNGGCSMVRTTPASVSPLSAYSRSVIYRYSSSDGYVLDSDSESTVNVVSRDFSTSQSKRVCIFTDLPCYDQNGNELGGRSPLQDFSLSYFMDGSGVYHHYISSSSTIAGNNSFDVDWFIFDGSYTFPVTVENDTIVKRTLTETYSNTNLRKYQEYFSKWYQYVYQSGALGVGSLGVVNPQFDYYFVPDKTMHYNNSVIDNSFSPSSIGSIYRYLNGDTLTTHVTQSVLDFDAQLFLKTRGGSDFSSSSDVAICACVHDNTNNKYILLVHKFNINDCLTAINSVKHANDNSNVSAPEPSNISDWQSLAEYLKNLHNNTTINNYINNNNLVDNITSFPWGSVINGGVGGALNEFPWSNVIGGGVGSALDDFLPNLSSEFDTVFTGLFNSFTVPTQEQLDDIEDEIAAEQDELHDKLSFVEDVKTEIYFLSSSIAAAGSDEPVFQYDVISLDVINNHVVVSDTHKQATLFRGNWIDVTTRERIKDVITVFASLSVLIYIWRTLPATIGNMPTDKGD